MKISSDFCTVYAFSPFSRDIAARTTGSRARRPVEALLGAAGRAEIPDATAAAAAPAILVLGLLVSREAGGGADEGGIRNSGGVSCDWVLIARPGPPNHDWVFSVLVFFFSFFFFYPTLQAR